MEVEQARYDFFLQDLGCTDRILRFPVEKLGVPPELGYEPRVAKVWHTRFGTQSLLQEVDLGPNRLIWGGSPERMAEGWNRFRFPWY